MNGRLFKIAGCSGAGKDTLIAKFLEKNPGVERSISVTTRQPRRGEKDGADYFFTSKDEFKKSADSGEFLEWAEFCGNFYGTKKSIVQKALEKGRDLILKIEVQGAKQIKEKMPEAKSIFIMPPSLKVLEERLRNRHTDSEEDVLKRLKAAEAEIEAGRKFDYTIINDTIENALEKLQNIFDKK